MKLRGQVTVYPWTKETDRSSYAMSNFPIRTRAEGAKQYRFEVSIPDPTPLQATVDNVQEVDEIEELNAESARNRGGE